MIASSVFAVLFWGIKFGIDFTGGSILEFEFTEQRIDKEEVSFNINEFSNNNNIDLGDISIRETGDKGYILRTKNIDDSTKNLMISTLETETTSSINEIRFNDIGPTMGDELKGKALVSILVVVISIILFVAFAFRKVSKPVSSWKYGFVAILAFFHDVLFPLGIFALLGHFYGIEVDTLFVVAILVVLGYSINDTIVVFDRIRENLQSYPDKKKSKVFESVVGKSINQTISRSLNTSLTTLVALGAIFFLGGESTKYFALALITGIVAGTYSSIFFASPMLVTIQKIQDKRSKNSSKKISEQ